MGIVMNDKSDEIDDIITKSQLNIWKCKIISKISKTFHTRYYSVLDRYESGHVPIASDTTSKHKDKYNIQKLSTLQLNKLFDSIDSSPPIKNIL
jgi:hypothetical protein